MKTVSRGSEQARDVCASHLLLQTTTVQHPLVATHKGKTARDQLSRVFRSVLLWPLTGDHRADHHARPGFSVAARIPDICYLAVALWNLFAFGSYSPSRFPP